MQVLNGTSQNRKNAIDKIASTVVTRRAVVVMLSTNSSALLALSAMLLRLWKPSNLAAMFAMIPNAVRSEC